MLRETAPGDVDVVDEEGGEMDLLSVPNTSLEGKPTVEDSDA
jgi:hypothetical protein